MTGILGRKIGMTRITDENGNMIPVTVVECTPNVIVQIKTAETDGYNAIVLGFAPYNKPSKNKKYQFIREFKVADVTDYKVGDTVSIASLQEAGTELEKAQITARSKGRGFQGVIKRHNFSRGPETHGSRHHREPGSVGACAMPGRVAKGKKLPGRMGSNKVTRRSIPIMVVDANKNVLALKGALPGAFNTFVQIQFSA